MADKTITNLVEYPTIATGDGRRPIVQHTPKYDRYDYGVREVRTELFSRPVVCIEQLRANVGTSLAKEKGLIVCGYKERPTVMGIPNIFASPMVKPIPFNQSVWASIESRIEGCHFYKAEKFNYVEFRSLA